jgi:hypothetical protein
MSDTRIIPCQACGGDGGHHDFGGNWGRCVVCEGSGEFEIELKPIGCAKCGAAIHSDDPQPGDWCLDCNFAFTPEENEFANKGKRIRRAPSTLSSPEQT